MLGKAPCMMGNTIERFHGKGRRHGATGHRRDGTQNRRRAAAGGGLQWPANDGGLEHKVGGESRPPAPAVGVRGVGPGGVEVLGDLLGDPLELVLCQPLPKPELRPPPRHPHRPARLPVNPSGLGGGIWGGGANPSHPLRRGCICI